MRQIARIALVVCATTSHPASLLAGFTDTLGVITQFRTTGTESVVPGAWETTEAPDENFLPFQTRGIPDSAGL